MIYTACLALIGVFRHCLQVAWLKRQDVNIKERTKEKKVLRRSGMSIYEHSQANCGIQFSQHLLCVLCSPDIVLGS